MIWILKTSFNVFCNEANSIEIMIDEVMVNKHTLPLLLQAIFFTMEYVGNIIFENYYVKTQHKMKKQKKSPTTKQMHYKFKLEKTKSNVSSKTYNLNVFWTILSTINSSNLLSISPRTPITSKAMVVVVNGWSIRWEKLRMVSFGIKCNFTRW